MIRINRENTLAMSRKRNPALDGYFDRVNLLLWPRLKAGAGPAAPQQGAGLPGVQVPWDP